MKLKIFLASILTLMVVMCSVNSAQDNQAEMMKKWQEYMTPGAPHQHFAKMVGNWNAVVTNYMGGQEMKAEGTAIYEMILGGRYLKGTFKANMMGMPMEGLGIDAFDNGTKEYLTLWMDNFGTGVMYLKGRMDDKTKNIIYTGTSYDPMSGKDVMTKIVMKYADDDHVVMEMYMVDNGQDTKNMQVEYTRAK